MSLAAILTACKAINGGISGVASAHDHTDLPHGLQQADLPAALALPDSGEMEYGGGGFVRSLHRLRILLYVSPANTGTLAEGYSSVVPFLELFRDRYAAAMALDSCAKVEWARITAYRLGRLEPYAGVEFLGIEFTLEVQEAEGVTVGL